MLPEKAALQCSRIELFTLASLMGGEMLIGLADPFRGWLTEEMDQAMRAARLALVSRKVLDDRGQAGFAMDASAALLLGAMIAPQAAILLSTTSIKKKAPQTQQTNFYWRDPILVMAQEVEKGHYLQLVSSHSAVRENIQQEWGYGDKKAVQGVAFRVPEQALQKTGQYIGQSEEESQKLLQKEGLSPALAKTFAHALISARRNGSLAILRPGSPNWTIEGVGMLACSKGLWMLRSIPSGNAHEAEFLPASGAELQKEIDLLLARCLPKDRVA